MIQLDLVPSDIRFMHDHISRKFSDGRSVNGTILGIICGHISVDDLPQIRVVYKDGYYYSFDNRRLYVYRVLHCRGLLDKVTVKWASMKQFQLEKFTTKNNGESVIVRRDITYEHYVSRSKNNINNKSYNQEDSDESNEDEYFEDDNNTDARSFSRVNYSGQLEELRLIEDAEQRRKSDQQENAQSSLATFLQRNSFSSTHSNISSHDTISTKIPSLSQPDTSCSLACNHSGDTRRSAEAESCLPPTTSIQSNVNNVSSSSSTQRNGSTHAQTNSNDTLSSIGQVGDLCSSKIPARSGANSDFSSSIKQMNDRTDADNESSVTWNINTLIVSWHSSRNTAKSGDISDSNSTFRQTGSTSSLATRSQVSDSTTTTDTKNNSNGVSLESASTESIASISGLHKNRFRPASPPISKDKGSCAIM